MYTTGSVDRVRWVVYLMLCDLGPTGLAENLFRTLDSKGPGARRGAKHLNHHVFKQIFHRTGIQATLCNLLCSDRIILSASTFFSASADGVSSLWSHGFTQAAHYSTSSGVHARVQTLQCSWCAPPKRLTDDPALHEKRRVNVSILIKTRSCAAFCRFLKAS